MMSRDVDRAERYPKYVGVWVSVQAPNLFPHDIGFA
jgi:hypothetical protein